MDRQQYVAQLIETLGFQWQDRNLLEMALTHTSFANENRNGAYESNQRLEFLGDAVLELITSNYLYHQYPNYPEGLLTKIRAAVVCEPSLAKVATQLSLGQCLRMGRGEERSGGRIRPSILADAFESVIGALFLDQGLAVATKVVQRFLSEEIGTFAQGGHAGDYKSELQELVQQEKDNLLEYCILKEEGPDHSKTFTAGVQYGGELWGTGAGRTKKEAEQAAARSALENSQVKSIKAKRSHG